MIILRCAVALVFISACVVSVINLQGCTHMRNGYQFGDATLSAIEAGALYCVVTSPEQKAALLAVIRAGNPDYPVEGICPQ